MPQPFQYSLQDCIDLVMDEMYETKTLITTKTHHTLSTRIYWNEWVDHYHEFLEEVINQMKRDSRGVPAEIAQQYEDYRLSLPLGHLYNKDILHDQLIDKLIEFILATGQFPSSRHQQTTKILQRLTRNEEFDLSTIPEVIEICKKRMVTRKLWNEDLEDQLGIYMQIYVSGVDIDKIKGEHGLNYAISLATDWMYRHKQLLSANIEYIDGNRQNLGSILNQHIKTYGKSWGVPRFSAFIRQCLDVMRDESKEGGRDMPNALYQEWLKRGGIRHAKIGKEEWMTPEGRELAIMTIQKTMENEKKIPSSRTNKKIRRIYRVLRDKEICENWAISGRIDLFRLAIERLDDPLQAELEVQLDKYIKSYG